MNTTSKLLKFLQALENHKLRGIQTNEEWTKLHDMLKELIPYLASNIANYYINKLDEMRSNILKTITCNEIPALKRLLTSVPKYDETINRVIRDIDLLLDMRYYTRTKDINELGKIYDLFIANYENKRFEDPKLDENVKELVKLLKEISEEKQQEIANGIDRFDTYHGIFKSIKWVNYPYEGNMDDSGYFND